MDITPNSGLSTPTDLIPNGFLCWAVLEFRGMKASKETNGAYADLQFTVFENQPLARKKLWDISCDPDDARNSEAWRTQGMANITRMLESAGFVSPADPVSYQKMNGATAEQIFKVLDGKRVAIRVKIEKGGDGYADKNKIGDYLTPNPASSGNKNYLKLLAGDHGVQVAPAAQGGFALQQSVQPAPAAQGAFGQPAQIAPAPSAPMAARPAFNPSGPGPAFLQPNNR